MKQAAARTTTNTRGGKSRHTAASAKSKQGTSNLRQQFVTSALNMSWQLALVVLVPILLGVQLDKALGTENLGVFLGMLLALTGSGLIVWRTLRMANRLPVPKLTAAQKRAIRRAYEDEEDDK